jgi:phage gp37-like protein
MSAPTQTIVKKYRDAMGRYVVETKQYYTERPWPVKEQELKTYTLPFTAVFNSWDKDGNSEGDWQEEEFELYGDEDEEELERKEKLRKEYEKRQAILKREYKGAKDELLDVENTWKSQWLLYTMKDVKEDLLEEKKEEEDEEEDGKEEDDEIPLKDIEIKIESEKDGEIHGTLTWTSLAASLEMMQKNVDWRLGDRLCHYGIVGDSWILKFHPENVQ